MANFYRSNLLNFTASDIGAVATTASQGLSDTEKSNARANIGAGTSNFSGSYNDLSNKPTIPTVNNATLTIQKNGTNVNTFTANASSNVTANITVPTKVSELTNDSGYTTNTGTVTSVKVGTTSYSPSSGVVSLPAYPSIPSNNVTGSGTSGKIAKFNGTNSITDGPAFGSSTTTYLRNDGTWGTPSGGSTVTIGTTGTASASAVSYQRVGIDGSYTEIKGTKYMESSTKTTANGVDTFTFTNAAITTSAVYDFYADVYGAAPSEVNVSSGSMTVKFASSQNVTKCRVYIQ